MLQGGHTAQLQRQHGQLIGCKGEGGGLLGQQGVCDGRCVLVCQLLVGMVQAGAPRVPCLSLRRSRRLLLGRRNSARCLLCGVGISAILLAVGTERHTCTFSGAEDPHAGPVDVATLLEPPRGAGHGVPTGSLALGFEKAQLLCDEGHEAAWGRRWLRAR